jgi:hypothetical protein
VSYDLVVWEGARPPTDVNALHVFRGLYDRHFNGGEDIPPSPQIQSYVARLVDRWPDVDPGAGSDHESPWTCRPLIGNASGPLIYFAVRASRAADVAGYAAALAAEAGLVCFDPQTGELR